MLSGFGALPRKENWKRIVSTGVLKNGFKGIYGAPIYSYIRNYKMNRVASILVTAQKKKITDAARRYLLPIRAVQRVGSGLEGIMTSGLFIGKKTASDNLDIFSSGRSSNRMQGFPDR